MAGKRKYPGKTDLIAARIPTELHDALKQRADREGRPKSEILVRSLERGLPDDETPKGGAFD